MLKLFNERVEFLKQKHTDGEAFMKEIMKWYMGSDFAYDPKLPLFLDPSALNPSRLSLPLNPELRDKLSAARSILSNGVSNFGLGGYSITQFTHSRWWWMREYLRVIYGVYEPLPNYMGLSDTVHLKLQHPATMTMVHLSVEDPTRVAYTPDIESGEQDRQRTVTLSKWLRTYCPLMKDDMMRDMEAALRSHASDEVFFYSGKDIVEVYRKMGQSCMSKEFDSLPDHPAAVYDAPGISIATLMPLSDKKNEAAARCLVYVNPDKPDDKRAIRNYGDAMLLMRLKKKGFKVGSLVGVKLKRIPFQYGGNKCALMPYLDDNGTSNSTGIGVMRLDDDWFEVISNNKLRKLTEKSPEYGGALGTAGYIRDLKLVPEDFDKWTSLTGKKYSDATDKHRVFVGFQKDELGRERSICGVVSRDELVTQFKDYWQGVQPPNVRTFDGEIPDASALDVNSRVPVRTFESGVAYSPEIACIRLQEYNIPELAPVLDMHGMLRISASSPHADRKYARSLEGHLKATDMNDLEGSRVLIPNDDAVHLIVGDEGGERLVLIDKQQLPKDAVKVARIKLAVPCYAAAGVKTVVTATKKTVVPRIHSVGRDALTGEYHFTHVLTEHNTYGGYIFYVKRGARLQLRNIPPGPVLEEMLVDECRGAFTVRRVFAAWYQVQGRYPQYPREAAPGMYVVNSADAASHGTLGSLKELVDELPTDEDIDKSDVGSKEYVKHLSAALRWFVDFADRHVPKEVTPAPAPAEEPAPAEDNIPF